MADPIDSIFQHEQVEPDCISSVDSSPLIGENESIEKDTQNINGLCHDEKIWFN